MKRRTVLQGFSVLVALPLIPACSRSPGAGEASSLITPLKKPHEEWRALVSPRAYQILFEEATERPESSNLVYEDRDGTFICAACYLPLFESANKYESWTGWPSFTQPIAGHVATRIDFKMIWPRTEYHCVRCGGHQGHLFSDGPPPRGERWCNNGIALKFVPTDEPLPALRS
ncbi:peptide-methionine (R)-S-oxide reductase [Nitrosomonas cryotolerans]|uniref:peptide-methionine (R)-S-oxide reductase n=1 Tax=Nitrosomonas cryotolerans ATCC 49181 TaxID=1131553 RepID=A0A1N6I868_9PROT|nr:peptide-methionine (R)-S-oxide reductase MsrB [Nitrosomonas cryotolerans]SFP97309.1 peptide-methionine (R)-S-oxide reductase [Nitrosomonas cryotolerans]SIO28212.1 peptide-methionine (R)-S-oxide reductase [Nitrosomonas cryotolerans ATCC 49181]